MIMDGRCAAISNYSLGDDENEGRRSVHVLEGEDSSAIAIVQLGGSYFSLCSTGTALRQFRTIRRYRASERQPLSLCERETFCWSPR
ncbi:hypothetical protein G7K_2966-t1 [Saitoella complicata NRRL Y-17804]|uniref:Uncharacterized protein n=1 Tax=Saitoella complicata (strain BCRC 22490 / CBS 7301 / JCM 7358 / NBRC 10748 / NRRL Y-17804) TaxID=698492 RepID=A0A0E9NFZ8_SAICN|nr:hypothetical protein G7K_2966-t1 [Saitoella complicata NRRL Y-17804]